MGLFSFIGWIFGWMFGFIFQRIDDVFVWILPSYMTVSVIKDSKETLFKNYLCFWAILSLILGIEHVTFYLFYYITVYRVCRLLFVIWLQMDYCTNAFNTFNKLQPYISPDYEKVLEKVFSSVISKVDEGGAAIQDRVSDQFWSFVKRNYEVIKEGVFSAMTTVSAKAVDLTDTNSNIAAKAGEEQKVEDVDKETVKKKES